MSSSPSSPHRVYDVLVVGLGPAGLAAVQQFGSSRSGSGWMVLGVEAGPQVDGRKHDEEDTLASGCGGASLFSDGKFSFAPAGSEVWNLPASSVDLGCRVVCDWLSIDGVPVSSSSSKPPAESGPASAEESKAAEGGETRPADSVLAETPTSWQYKEYPTLHVGLQARLALIRRLHSEISRSPCVDLEFDSRCVSLEPIQPSSPSSPSGGASAGSGSNSSSDTAGGVGVNVSGGAAVSATSGGFIAKLLRRGESEPETVIARAVIVTNGRLGPLALPPAPEHAIRRRVEVGVRICGKPSQPLFRLGRSRADCLAKDPKFIRRETVALSDGSTLDAEFRTFCWCHKGFTAFASGTRMGLPDSFGCWSGWHDCDSPHDSDESNVGLMVRVCGDVAPPVPLDCPKFRSEVQLGAATPKDVAMPFPWNELIARGLQLCDPLQFQKDPLSPPDVATAASPATPPVYTLVGPCVEGVGDYLHVSAPSLRVGGASGPRMWAAGDASGVFRGLVPAVVSGVHVALEAAAALEAVRLRALEALKVKVTALGPGPGPAVAPPNADLSALPPMVGAGAGSPAMQEIHIFLLPLDPDETLVDRFNAVASAYNEAMEDVSGARWKRMKPCHLALFYRAHGRYVCVMQSARYHLDDDPATVVRMAHEEDAELFRLAGFNVVRVKIEASAHGIVGIPDTEQAAEQQTKLCRYFEHHVKLQRMPTVAAAAAGGATVDPMAGAPTEEELSAMSDLSRELEARLRVPVPLSYNKAWFEDTGRQRFINLRFRDTPVQGALAHVKRAVEAVPTVVPGFKVQKCINEWVWYDTYTAMDAGWIDPSGWSIIVLSGKRFAGKDSFADALQAAASRRGVAMHRVSFARELKRQYAEFAGVSFEGLLTDHHLKDAHRGPMTAFFDAAVEKDPTVFATGLASQVLELTRAGCGVVVVTDLRYRRDWETLVSQVGEMNAKWRRVRIVAPDAAKRERGWTPSPYDSHSCEVDLDGKDEHWDLIVDNASTLESLEEPAEKLLGDLAI